MVEVSATMPGSSASGTIHTPAPPTVDPSKTAGSAKVVGAPFKIGAIQENDRWFKALFYARHGIGKTELAGSSVDVPEMNDILYIDAEKSYETLIDNPRIKNWAKIKRVPISNFQQASQLLDFCRVHCRWRDAGNTAELRKLWKYVSGEDVENPPQFRTVILDSWTEVDAYSNYQVLNIKIDGDNAALPTDLESSGWPEYRRNLEQMKLLSRAYRDLPMNVIFVCSELYKQDEMKKYHYFPALTGQLGMAIQGFVDMVGYLVTKTATEDEPEADRRLYVQPISGGPKFDAKNRKSVYRASYFDKPNMISIMKGIGMVKTSP